jgi:hypothetical protein
MNAKEEEVRLIPPVSVQEAAQLGIHLLKTAVLEIP